MSEIYAVEIPGVPNQANRFVTFFGNEYSGVSSLQFVPLTRVIRKNAAGVLAGDKPQSMCRKMVDDLHAHAASGGGAPYLATARVLKYLGPDKYQIVYVGKETEVRQAEPEVPKVMKAHDGTWRVVPTKNWQKGPREWRFSIAFVDRDNTPRAEYINGKTKLDVVNKLFEPSMIGWMNDYILSLPLAEPQDIPTPVAPKVERVYTQQELDAVLPLDPKVYNALSVAEHKKRYLFDPLYQVAFDKMNDLEMEQKAQAAERQRKLDKDAELKKMREQFLKDEEDDRRKGGGGKGGPGSVGTIL